MNKVTSAEPACIQRSDGSKSTAEADNEQAGSRRRARQRKRGRKSGVKGATRSFVDDIKHRARETAGLGHLLVTEPRSFPGALGRVAKRSAHTLWHARGGGFYACGFVLAFIGLNLKSLFDEIVSSTGVGSFIAEEIFGIFFRFTVESLENTVFAFLWPLYVIQFAPVWGGALLVALFVVFNRFIKDPLEDWLFDDDDEQEAEQPQEDPASQPKEQP